MERETDQITKIGRLSLLTALNRFSFSLTMVVLPLFSLAIGQDEAFYGTLVAAAGYVQSIALFPAGTLSDRKGRGVSILIGGLASGFCFFLLPFAVDTIMVLVLYALTGIGGGFMRTSIDTLLADYTKRGHERTRSYGYTIAIATLAATIGPFLGGFILDETAFPGIGDMMFRFAIVFYIMGAFRFITGFTGLITERWLIKTQPKLQKEISPESVEEQFTTKDDTRTALLFGFGDLLMGISSGMVIPYILPWIYATYTPDPVVFGAVPSIANLTLASGALVVGLTSEKTGKLRMIGFLYLLTPFLAIGLVYAPAFLIMLVFYVSRNAVANMVGPARNSLLMGEISTARRGRILAVTRVMWTFPRQTGTLFTAYLLSIGFLGGIITFGQIFFPIALILYPVSVIPVYVAVRMNRSNLPHRES
jgi:MFS family permease